MGPTRAATPTSDLLSAAGTEGNSASASTASQNEGINASGPSLTHNEDSKEKEWQKFLKSNLKLTRSDLDRLKGSTWLNDELVNCRVSNLLYSLNSKVTEERWKVRFISSFNMTHMMDYEEERTKTKETALE
ncbi:hypothetical protein SCHPADRAFT_948320 [Schizopora paradoxa]|uniref:Uncharacterized protein n=1 Tax=Schizopora paradoxa TaxID=27342 RepID=A0A0H2QWU4_9AGAM|nr:hypothetical protein SCHPADRAFT_948320 [Schizopora paradoxa]